MYSELFKHPVVSFERLRREHISDDIIGEIKTIADLGVKLETVEDRFPFEFKYFRCGYSHEPVNFRNPEVELPPSLKY